MVLLTTSYRAMGPTKKLADSVGKGQKTISSFFQQKPEQNSASSKIFSSVVNVPAKHDLHSCNEKNRVVKPSSKEHECNTDVIVIPETQILQEKQTPDRSSRQKAGDDDDIIPITPDIIPVTPESDESVAAARRKRLYGRSFLTAGNAIGSKPFSKVKNEKSLKQKLTQAKKNLISISVQFNNKSNESEKKTIEMADDTNTISETVNIVTPTKIYESEVHGTSIKRMAKERLSPDSKRLSGGNNPGSVAHTYGDGAQTEHNDDQLEGERSKVKRVLSLSEKLKKKQLNCENLTSICNYQLGMLRPKKNPLRMTTSTEQMETDNVLSDILLELSPCISRSDASQRKSSDKLLKRKGKVSMSCSDRGSLANNLIENALSLDLNDEEKKFFEEIKVDVSKKNIDTDNECLNINSNIDTECDVVLTETASTMSKSTMALPLEPNLYEQKPLDCFADSDSELLLVSGDDKICETNHSDVSVSSRKYGSVHVEEVYPIGDGVMKEVLASNQVTPKKTSSQELCDEFLMLSPFDISFEDRFDEANKHLQRHPPSEAFGRHIVTEVSFCSEQQEIWLGLTAVHGKMKRRCVLRNFWADTHVAIGDVVNVIGQFDEEGTCCIDDGSGLIIVNPDVLLSGTSVVSSVFCMRKSVLNEKYKGLDAGNIHMLYGSIIHCVFQQVLKKGLTGRDSIRKEAEESIKNTKFLHDMYNNNVDEGVVLEEVEKYIPQLILWIDRYTRFKHSSHSLSSNQNMVVTKIHDIEENIWSPRFGVKGKIDLTVEVKIQKSHGTWQNTVLPLELKTGKPTFSVEHKGQVTLYSMMTSDRRDDPEQGLLLYLRDPEMKIIPANHSNKRGLIQLRNEMAHYLSGKIEKTDEASDKKFVHYHLPEPLNNPRACSKCPHLLNCALYQKSVESRHFNQTMSNLVPDTLKHLTDDDLEYFSRWCLMLELENMAGSHRNQLRDIWCKTGSERETEGKCIGGLIISRENTLREISSDLCVLSFCRFDKHPRSDQPLSSIGLCDNEMVVINGEKPVVIALCTAIVSRVTDHTLELIVERDSVPRLTSTDLVFRIDKYDGYSTTGLLYTNLARFMSDDTHSQRLRGLIIGNRKPLFTSTLSKGCIEQVKNIFKPLNKPQKTAILKVLMSKDYTLIKGYPGTGKTSTIVALVKVLEILGQTVLLTSYTHSAVDNILLKLKKDGVKFLRLGRLSRIHPDIHEFAAESLLQSCTTVSQLRKFYQSQKIIATSCLGTTHPVFNQRKFDVCIIDEASQVVQPACLGPLLSAERFVLVGDPKQLPPVVQSKDARSLGMDISLFAHLDAAGATYELNLQYRMNSDIMELSNLLTYGGALKCGSESIATANLQPPHVESVKHIITENQWIDGVISPDAQAVVFLDTNKTPAPETRDGSGLVQNKTEARLVCIMVKCLIMAGVAVEDIGIIAPYRNQVLLIKRLLQGNSQSDISCVEVNTVDQYQGRDKCVIVISLVRSSLEKDSKGGELLKDVRRLNVAVTRAKQKLILLGNRETLTQYPPLETIISTLTERKAIIPLPSLEDIVKLEAAVGILQRVEKD